MTISVRLGVGKFYLGGIAVPAGAEFVGTVVRDGFDSGALVRFCGTGRYSQVNAGCVRALPQREVIEALAASESWVVAPRRVNSDPRAD